VRDPFEQRVKRTNAQLVQAVRRTLPPGVTLDLSFADAVLAAYEPLEASETALEAAAALGHYRLAAAAAAQAAMADAATLAFDLAAGDALRHLADAVAAGGRWLANAYDLRLPRGVAPDPAAKEFLARIAFADPKVHAALVAQQTWLRDIQGIGRRAQSEPLGLRADRSDRIPGVSGAVPAALALAEHQAELDRYLRTVTAAALAQLAAGPRPSRATPDAAWLNE